MKEYDIVQILPYFAVGGAENVTKNLLLEMKNRKISVSVISLFSKKSNITDELEREGIDIFYLNKKSGLDFLLINRLRKLLKKLKPKVIHTHLYILPYVYYASAFTKVKIVHTFHSIAGKEMNEVYRKIYKYVLNKKRVKTVAISNEVKKSIVSEYGLKSENIAIIKNGVYIDKYIPKKDYSSKLIQIVHVGRFMDVKNHKLLISAFSKIHHLYPYTRLVLCGDGELIDEIKQLVIDLDLIEKVEFMGNVSNINEILTRSDIFVLPSKWEGMPLSLIEAMATGLPIIANKVGGIIDMIDNNVNGLLFVDEEKDFISKLESLLTNEELREKLGKKALISSKEYITSKMLEDYLEVYEIKK